MSSDLITKMLDLVKADSAEEDRKLHRLQHILSFEPADPKVLETADELGIKIVTFDDVLKAGKENDKAEFVTPKTEDVLMLSYTSGTTGDPKGVKLTH